MDMQLVNAAMEAEKQRNQFAKIDTALATLVTMVTELKAEVASLKNPSPVVPMERTVEGRLKTAKRLGEQTQE